MPCQHIAIGGIRAIVCTRGRKRAPGPCIARCGIEHASGDLVQCAGASEYLCDWPTEGRKTCDAPLCEAHAREVGRNRHYCPAHFSAHLRAQVLPQRGLFNGLGV